MKKVTLAAMAAMILASGASAGDDNTTVQAVSTDHPRENFIVCKYVDDSNGFSADRNRFYNANAEGQISLGDILGPLQTQQVYISTQSGNVGIGMGWSQFLQSSGKKIEHSKNPAREITYLVLPFSKHISKLSAEEVANNAANNVTRKHGYKQREICNIDSFGDTLDATSILSYLIRAASNINDRGGSYETFFPMYLGYLKNYLSNSIDTDSEIVKHNFLKFKKGKN